ncbi:MAG: hypothetical protein A4E32_00204 [Methanomassiliicoccales archaeon PtaU1.Bin124]|nr:MAG: hypothetical protein A4E32_00204 [Methanomassiliicoccales archaeon PtaU1.Bin124]
MTPTNLFFMSLHDTVRTVGEFMELSARTAPKGLGQDFIETVLLDDDQRVRLGQDMLELARQRSLPGFKRDGQNVLDADAVILIGLMPHKGAGLDCQACGLRSCEEFNKRSSKGDFEGPNCAIRMLDLGIALGSAVKTASDMNVDNRIMYRIGVSARRLGLCKAQIVHGIPLSAKGKNIFFDRPTQK